MSWIGEIPMQCRRIIYKAYFKQTATYNAKIGTLQKRCKNKDQAMNMNSVRSSEEKTRRDKIIYGIFKELRIQSLLMGLEQKQLQWFGHIKRMNRTRTEKGIRI
jgi:hypothetical protein